MNVLVDERQQKDSSLENSLCSDNTINWPEIGHATTLWRCASSWDQL